MSKELKIAISCDYLLVRSHYSEIVESLCEVFPEATLYCFAHKKGAILGKIEQRPIRSTYLSNTIKSAEEFYEASNKLPSLAKNLFISCEYDLIINISKGFSQGFSKCEKTKIITYLYDLDLNTKVKKTILQKLMFPFIDFWVKKSLSKVDVLLTSREDLKSYVDQIKPHTVVVPPPFRISDYALFPKEMFKHQFYLVDSVGLSLEEATNIISWFKEWNLAFQFIGQDFHLKELKKIHPESMFFGHRCSGEHTPVLAACKAYISFNQDDFPAMALGSLATGRPIVISVKMKKWIDGEGVFFTSGQSPLELKKMLDLIPDDEQLDPRKLRAHAVFYHDIKFKAEMKRTIDKAIADWNQLTHSHNHESTSDCSQCN
jgi:hypothetical protein